VIYNILVTDLLLAYIFVVCGRSGGLKGLFTGVGPRVARAGPSVGIVVSFYEVVKYAIHQRHTS
jgi:L-asparagine transporter-like permease